MIYTNTPNAAPHIQYFIKIVSGILGSRHSSYTSHQSRISYTSHGDLLGTKEQKLRHRSRNQSVVMQQPMPGGGGVGGAGAGAAGIYNTDINHKGHRDYVSVRPTDSPTGHLSLCCVSRDKYRNQ